MNSLLPFIISVRISQKKYTGAGAQFVGISEQRQSRAVAPAKQKGHQWALHTYPSRGKNKILRFVENNDFLCFLRRYHRAEERVLHQEIAPSSDTVCVTAGKADCHSETNSRVCYLTKPWGRSKRIMDVNVL